MTLKRFADDPFESCQPPDGMAYQWVTIKVHGEIQHASTWQPFVDAGWQWVRTSRHPEFNSDDADWILFQGQALMEIAREKWEKLAVVPINEARSMDDKYRRIMTGPAIKNQSYSVTDFPNYVYAASSHAESTYGPIPKDAPPIVVTATVQIVADAKWQDAAAVCAMTVEKYVQARIDTAISHGLVSLLLPRACGGSFEFFDDFKNIRGSDV